MRLTVVQTDLAIDSNNDNVIDLTENGSDDGIEDLHILAGGEAKGTGIISHS